MGGGKRYTSKKLDKDAKVTIFESNDEAIHRCVLYIKNVLNTVNWEIDRPKVDDDCYNLGNKKARIWRLE